MWKVIWGFSPLIQQLIQIRDMNLQDGDCYVKVYNLLDCNWLLNRAELECLARDITILSEYSDDNSEYCREIIKLLTKPYNCSKSTLVVRLTEATRPNNFNIMLVLSAQPTH